MLWIFFLIVIFILFQKNAFGQKQFQISCMSSKVPCWNDRKIAKIGSFSQNNSFEALCMKMAIRKVILNLLKSAPNLGFMQKKVQRGIF